MTPTDENIRVVVDARKRRISDDARVRGISYSVAKEFVIERADHYATRNHNPAKTAQEAVAWAITDLPRRTMRP